MKRIYLLPLLLLAGLSAQQALAQPSTGGPAPTAPTPTTVPLDGGAALLLAGGITYAVRQLRAQRRTFRRKK